MAQDTESCKCFHCGHIYRDDYSGQNKGMVCSGCGMEMAPIFGNEKRQKDTGQFRVLLGFFTIVALLGAIGGMMAAHGWSVWVAFAMIGGMVYFVAKIFLDKYCIIERIGVSPEETPEAHTEDTVATDFERLVVEAIHELPQRIRDHLSGVSVVVQDKPAHAMVEKLKLVSNSSLLGVFEGVPMNRRSVWHSGVMPERITIFQKNIEANCRSEEEIKRRVKRVVRHEIAHFVGFSEEEVRKMGY